MNPCFAVLPYTFIPNTAQSEWSFLLRSRMKCAATTAIHPATVAEHRPLEAPLIKQKSCIMLEKLQMQIKAAQHSPNVLQNQTVCILN